jgi:molecular chaperone DnaK (HSP70)
VEQTTGVNCKITIANYKASLSTQEIHRMVQDAEKYEVEDDEHKKKVRAKEASENYAYKMRNILNGKEIGEKLGAAVKQVIIDLLDGVQHAKGDDN